MCGINPFAKFALQILYTKMSGKFARIQGVSINDQVRTNLAFFKQEIVSSLPLDIMDVALEHRGRDTANVLVFPDACLTSDDGTAGLGFWYRTKSGHHMHFYHRLLLPENDIIFAKSLAVFSAIVHVATTLRPKRLLHYTDSSAAVYNFDSGKAHGRQLDLIWSTFDTLRACDTDLRIRHIPGKNNQRADDLSRLPVSILSQRHNHYEFSPPFYTPGRVIR